MPNKRGANQTCVAFQLHSDLALALDQAPKKTRENRSDFIRCAIAEELRKRGIEVPPGTEDVPDRVRNYPRHAPTATEFNDKPEKGKAAKRGSNSKVDAVATALLKRAVAEVESEDQGPNR